MTVEQRFRALLATGALDLPALGAGATPERLRRMTTIARDDLVLARLVEAHVDAIQILREAGRTPAPGAWYGVWAAEDPEAVLTLHRTESCLLLNGTKAFCTGAGLVDRALVTVRTPASLLIDIDLRDAPHGIVADTSAWITPAFAEAQTAVVAFHDIVLTDDALVGGPGWYLDRPGFWNGATGPPACWAGGAIGLVDWAIDRCVSGMPDPHRDAATGALSALGFQMEAVLDHAGRLIDRDPYDEATARIRSLQTRQSIERACADVLDHFGRAFGPRPLAFEDQTHRRYLEVQLYIRQCHAERDLANLGSALRSRVTPGGE